MRWDRIGRVGLLVVLAVVGALYVEHTLSFFATRARAQAAQAEVRQLVSANARLAGRRQSLSNPATIAAQARRLGMVKAGERPYVVTGIAPSH